MKRHEDLIDREANARSISEAHEMRQQLSSWREESKEKIRLQEKEQSAKEFGAIQSWLRVNETDQLTIFESVSAQADKYPGTCSWALDNPKIKAWLRHSSQTQLLWLSGTAGSGKSVISTQLIKFMSSLPNTAVLYHFCTNTLTASSEYDKILKSLLEQLLRQDVDLTAHVYHEYVLKKHLGTVSTLEQLLHFLLTSSTADPQRPTHIRIVLDGVDELRDHSPNLQARLLSLMKQIVSKSHASDHVAVKVLVSSRPSTTVSHVLRRKPILSLTEEKKCLEVAIQEYASQRLRSLQARFQQLGLHAAELEDICRQISKKADGK